MTIFIIDIEILYIGNYNIANINLKKYEISLFAIRFKRFLCL
jgi:hypothetical protein